MGFHFKQTADGSGPIREQRDSRDVRSVLTLLHAEMELYRKSAQHTRTDVIDGIVDDVRSGNN